MPKPHAHALLGVIPPGTVVGYWTVVAEAKHQHGLRFLTCRCVCGTERDVFIGALRIGASSSCGCQNFLRNRTHGMSSSPEYGVWKAINQRCHNPKSSEYRNYGGRGIQVCQQWRESFAAFFAATGLRPSPEMTIDRIDNDGNYEPGNVRWATRTEQNNNTRRTHAERVAHARRSMMKRWHPNAAETVS